MTAQPRPSGDKPTDAEMFIAEHQAKYSDSISRAREAAATTQTPAWLANYEAQVKTHRQHIAAELSSIKDTCSRIATADSNEDDEKSVRDSVKSMAEERIRFAAWRHRAVSVYETSVNECDGIIRAAVTAAQNAEQKSPLINSGLAGRIGAIIAKWPRAKWDNDHGVVTVDE